MRVTNYASLLCVFALNISCFLITAAFTTKCGDGVLDPGEACDDGDTNNGDGCDNACQIEIGACGNGLLENGEQCDDGNVSNGDSCDSLCQIEAGICGNGLLENGEQCDDNNTLGGDGCSATCQSEVCGDGIIQSALGEQCDDGDQDNTNTCKNDCTIPFCGDGVVSSGEVCDDGNTSNGDSCDSTCTVSKCDDQTLDSGILCFQAPSKLFMPSQREPRDVALSDLDNDSDLDIFVANAGDASGAGRGVQIFINDGVNGLFSTGQSINEVGGGPNAIVAADFDNNARPEIVVANFDTRNISILSQDGTDFYQAPITILTETAPGAPDALVAVDGNSDSNIDLFVADIGLNKVTFFQGDGSGNFTVLFGGITNTFGASPRRIAVGNFNGDTLPDAVISNEGDPNDPNDDNDTLIFGVATGTPAQLSLPQRNRPFGLALGDLNGDPSTDIVTTNAGSNLIRINLGAGNGTFDSFIEVTVGNEPRGVALSDLDADNDIDVIVTDFASNDVRFVLNLGGNFVAQPPIDLGASAGPERGPALGDLNADGIADVVIPNRGDNSISIILSNP